MTLLEGVGLLAHMDSDFQEEFCYPVECLALTVEEVMHIRQVLVKAELEKYQQYKDVYTALKKGKVESPFQLAGHAGTICCQVARGFGGSRGQRLTLCQAVPVPLLTEVSISPTEIESHKV